MLGRSTQARNVFKTFCQYCSLSHEAIMGVYPHLPFTSPVTLLLTQQHKYNNLIGESQQLF
jgi:hypothetical protein